MNLRYVKCVFVYVFLDFNENVKEVFSFGYKLGRQKEVGRYNL